MRVASSVENSEVMVLHAITILREYHYPWSIWVTVIIHNCLGSIDKDDKSE